MTFTVSEEKSGTRVAVIDRFLISSSERVVSPMGFREDEGWEEYRRFTESGGVGGLFLSLVEWRRVSVPGRSRLRVYRIDGCV